MNIKNTKLWSFARKVKNERLAKKEYLKMKNMPLCDYEDYLVARSFEMMNRNPVSKPYAYNINFSNPQTFTEKRQWLKLYYQDIRQSKYTDKYEVRKHIEEVLGKGYLIPLISIDGKDCFSSVDEIDFNNLPNSFVIKCTHGSHMNIIVKDKDALSKSTIRKYKKQLNKWLNTNYAYKVALELHYKDIEPRIIIEEYIDNYGSALTDYKFFCFSGVPEFVGIFEDRGTADYKETYVDMDYKKMPYRLDKYSSNDGIEKPSTFDDMKKIVKVLCEDYPMVRVDLYTINNRIYFGELTFTSAAGYDFPNPFEYDKVLGKLIKIDSSKRDNNYTYRKNEKENNALHSWC